MESHTVGDDTKFRGDSFVVKSGLVGMDYVIKTGVGEPLLRAQREFFADGLGYVYTDESEVDRFRYEETGADGQCRQFELVDASTDAHLATLERTEGSWHRWRLDAGPSGTVEIVGEPGEIPIFDPQRGRHMTVEGSGGERVGSVDRRILAVHFMFDVEITGLQGDAKAAVLLAVPLLYDAMQAHSSLLTTNFAAE